MKLSITNILKSRSSGRPEDLQEDDFRKNLLSNGIGAIVLAPILVVILLLFDFPKVAIWSNVTYIAMFPLYAFVCAFNVRLRDKLIYFLIILLYFWSAVNIVPLSHVNTSAQEVIMAIVAYFLSVIIIQRFVFAVIYQVLIITFLVYMILTKEDAGANYILVLILVVLIGSSNILMMTARRAILSSLERYSSYLKNLLNSTRRGFVLFEWTESKKIHDFNDETNSFLRGGENFEQKFFNLFDVNELEKVNNYAPAISLKKRFLFHLKK